MNKNERERRKDLERLKWDYWNTSEAFKSFWRYVREIHISKTTPLPDQFKPINDNQNRKINHPIFSATREYWPYFLYQEPETASFDEYWTETMVFRDAIEKNEKSHKRIEDYRELITKDIDDIVGKFKNEKKRKPTIEELKYCLINGPMNPSCFVWLQITQIFFTEREAEERGKEVIRILKNRIVKTKPEPKALRKNLDAWTLRHDKDMSYIDIYDSLNKGVFATNKYRSGRRLVENRDKIIENLETGKEPWWCLNGRYMKKSIWSVIQEGDKLPP